MTAQSPANLYTQGFGSRPENVEVPVVTNVAPTASQSNYPIGKRWINTATNSEYVLTSSTTSAGVTTPAWTLLESGLSSFLSLTGDTGAALPSAGNVKIAGTANQITSAASGSTVTLSLIGPYTPATYTAHGVLLGEGTSSIVATAVGATNSVLQGSTGADPSFTTTPTVATLTTTGLLTAGNAIIATTGNITATTGNIISTNGSVQAQTTVTAGTSITASNGNITATSGNFVSSAAGNGIQLNSGTASGTNSATLNGRSGQVTVTTPTINAGSTFTFTLTNSSVTASTTQVLYGLTGGTTGSAITIQSVTNSASTSTIVVQNASAVTNSTGSLVLTFLVIN